MHDALFISHGAPDIAIADTAASRFLRDLGSTMDLPSAFVVVTAHFESDRVLVSGDAHPETIHDFGGFDDRLRSIVYRAPGDPELAERIASGLVEKGHDARVVKNRGLDHGTWVPLRLMHPKADIPVVQISVNPAKNGRWHFELGAALRFEVPADVAIIGSGAFTHNLQAVFASVHDRDAVAPDWVVRFEEWMRERLVAGEIDEVLDYREQAPFARKNHPTEEHIAPLFVALGASRHRKAEVLHESHEFGALAMSAFAFN